MFNEAFNTKEQFFKHYYHMVKTEYNIEYSWKGVGQLITMVVLCDVDEDHDLIDLTDGIYKTYKNEYPNVEIYYFTSKEAATKFVYVKFVQKKGGEDVLVESGCVGHLIQRKLTGRMSPPKLLKIYQS